MERVLEPEVMDTAEEASDYNAMDHGDVNARFCADLLAEGSIGKTVLDVGTGTALIPLELCRREPTVCVTAVDLAGHMLAVGRDNVARAGLQHRITLEKIDAKALPFPSGEFSTTISNSIIHHIACPGGVLTEIHRVTKAGGLVFIRDLARPESDAEVDRLVALYAGEPPTGAAALASFENQRELLRASLKAALTLSEVAEMARAAGMAPEAARMTSDRHWTLAFRKP